MPLINHIKVMFYLKIYILSRSKSKIYFKSIMSTAAKNNYYTEHLRNRTLDLNIKTRYNRRNYYSNVLNLVLTRPSWSPASFFESSIGYVLDNVLNFINRCKISVIIISKPVMLDNQGNKPVPIIYYSSFKNTVYTDNMHYEIFDKAFKNGYRSSRKSKIREKKRKCIIETEDEEEYDLKKNQENIYTKNKNKEIISDGNCYETSESSETCVAKESCQSSETYISSETDTSFCESSEKDSTNNERSENVRKCSSSKMKSRNIIDKNDSSDTSDYETDEKEFKHHKQLKNQGLTKQNNKIQQTSTINSRERHLFKETNKIQLKSNKSIFNMQISLATNEDKCEPIININQIEQDYNKEQEKIENMSIINSISRIINSIMNEKKTSKHKKQAVPDLRRSKRIKTTINLYRA